MEFAINDTQPAVGNRKERNNNTVLLAIKTTEANLHTIQRQKNQFLQTVRYHFQGSTQA